MSECEYCRYRNSWDCEDGYYRVENCSNFELDWSMISDEDKKAIRELLNKKDKYTDWW